MPPGQADLLLHFPVFFPVSREFEPPPVPLRVHRGTAGHATMSSAEVYVPAQGAL